MVLKASINTLRPVLKRMYVTSVEEGGASVLVKAEKLVTENAAKTVKTKFFTKKEMFNMKPSELRHILEQRSDIPLSYREWIHSPEKLNLYDEVMKLEEVIKMEASKKEEFLKRLFSQFNERTSEATAQLEVIPKLIKKGYNPKQIADLRICEYNKDIIEKVLERKDLPDKYVDCWLKINGDRLDRFGGEGHLTELRESAYENIIRYADNNNLKYLDECLEFTADLRFLPYWKKDTGKIFNEYFPSTDINYKEILIEEVLDRIHRNGHNFDSIKAILGDKKMTAVTQRLLEYKHFEKFKNISLENFDTLSLKEKKEFIRAYITAITPKELLYRSQHRLETGMEELPKYMKIYEGLNHQTTETLVNSYYNILRSLIEKIPANERTIIRSAIDTKNYRRQYRINNPIPSMVDELGNVLNIETRIIKGKKVKFAKMSYNPEFGIATHRFPNPESILTIQALEETNPEMFLCVGTKSGKSFLNFYKSGQALIVKPRRAKDWHVQAEGDIDSGNNATKNPFNFEQVTLRRSGSMLGAVNLIPEALKNELDLSQREYTEIMKTISECRTLQEIGKINPLMEKAIRNILKEENLSEGIIRPETMGVAISESKPLEEVSDDILNYCILRDIPLVQVAERPPKPRINCKITIEA